MTPDVSTGDRQSAQYDQAFYQQHQPVTYASAKKLVPLVVNWLDAQSIVDVGCGQGHWLIAAAEVGISDLTGFDGPWVDPKAMTDCGIGFKNADLRQPLTLDRRYDLALCIEVAEHLPESRAKGIVAELCGAADAVLFSAAAPLQGGTGHVNEQRPSYWAALFAEHGFECFDVIRPRFWSDEQVGWWYRQNALMFATNQAADRLRQLDGEAVGPPLDIVHPVAYEAKLREAQQTLLNLQRAVQRPRFRQVLSYGFRWAKSVLRRDRGQ